MFRCYQSTTIHDTFCYFVDLISTPSPMSKSTSKDYLFVYLSLYFHLSFPRHTHALLSGKVLLFLVYAFEIRLTRTHVTTQITSPKEVLCTYGRSDVVSPLVDNTRFFFYLNINTILETENETPSTFQTNLLIVLDRHFMWQPTTQVLSIPSLSISPIIKLFIKPLNLTVSLSYVTFSTV